METIKIPTPDNIDIEYRLAGVGSRMAAAIIDTLIQAAILLTVFLVLLLTVWQRDISHLAGYALNSWGTAVLILSLFVIMFGYHLFCELIMDGRSVGKKILGLRVIRENGQSVRFRHSLVRNLFRYFVDMFGVGILTIFFTKKNKRIGDMVSSTIVIAENNRRNKTGALTADDLLPDAHGQNPESIWLTDRTPLTKDEYELVREYLIRKDSFPDQGKCLRDQLAAYFAGQLQMDEKMINDETLQKLFDSNA